MNPKLMQVIGVAIVAGVAVALAAEPSVQPGGQTCVWVRNPPPQHLRCVLIIPGAVSAGDSGGGGDTAAMARIRMALDSGGGGDTNRWLGSRQCVWVKRTPLSRPRNLTCVAVINAVGIRSMAESGGGGDTSMRRWPPR